MEAIIDNLRSDFEVRISKAEKFLKGKVMAKVAALPSQDCYGIFGVCNNTLEELEHLNRMLISGLEDDALVGITRGTDGLWVVGYVGEYHTTLLSTNMMMQLLEEKPKAAKYYKENSDAINNRGLRGSPERSEYLRLARQYDDLVISFMQVEDREAILAERLQKSNDLKARVAKYKADKLK
jgi:hypothetical protein